MLINPIGILTNPKKQWQEFANAPANRFSAFIPYLLVMTALPSAAWYYGTTQIGWKIGDGEITRLTSGSAMMIAGAMYVAAILCIIAIGYSIHVLSAKAENESSTLKGVAFAALAATPFLLMGVACAYPMFWVDMLVWAIGICWSLYLMFSGIAPAMKIPEDQGIIFASALVGVMTLFFMIMLGFVTLLWDSGILPVFAD